MSYTDPAERRERVADAATRLLAMPDFRFLCEAWISELVDKHNEILALDGVALSRAQGAATELKRILEAVYGASSVAEKLALFTANIEQRGRPAFLQVPGYESDQA